MMAESAEDEMSWMALNTFCSSCEESVMKPVDGDDSLRGLLYCPICKILQGVDDLGFNFYNLSSQVQVVCEHCGNSDKERMSFSVENFDLVCLQCSGIILVCQQSNMSATTSVSRSHDWETVNDAAIAAAVFDAINDNKLSSFISCSNCENEVADLFDKQFELNTGKLTRVTCLVCDVHFSFGPKNASSKTTAVKNVEKSTDNDDTGKFSMSSLWNAMSPIAEVEVNKFGHRVLAQVKENLQGDAGLTQGVKEVAVQGIQQSGRGIFVELGGAAGSYLLRSPVGYTAGKTLADLLYRWGARYINGNRKSTNQI